MRPSFVDTGEYIAAFKAWTEGELPLPGQSGGVAGTVEGDSEAGSAEAAEDVFAGIAEVV